MHGAGSAWFATSTKRLLDLQAIPAGAKRSQEEWFFSGDLVTPRKSLTVHRSAPSQGSGSHASACVAWLLHPRGDFTICIISRSFGNPRWSAIPAFRTLDTWLRRKRCTYERRKENKDLELQRRILYRDVSRSFRRKQTFPKYYVEQRIRLRITNFLQCLVQVPNIIIY